MNPFELYSSLKEAISNDLAVQDESPAVKRLSERWDKRFVPDLLVQKELDEKARKDFVLINDEVTPPNLEGVDPVIIGEAQAFIYRALTGFTATHSDVPQSELDLDLLYSFWRFGPGSSKGVTGTHFADKIRQAFTTTAKCLPLVRFMRTVTPLINLFDLKHPCSEGVRTVRGSGLGSVGKNREKNRTIATEPSGNMAIQLALGVYIQLALKWVGLDIECQEAKNKSLACLASLWGKLCTIDLSSASDLISIELIQLLWPTVWYQWFMTTRSSECEVKQNTWLKLNMMSTMGNGFTFPMMTMTLLALLFGYMRSRGDLKNNRVDYTRIGVYGDDIICPVEYYDGFVELLHKMGLKVNVQKSYATGPFRESCGGDYHHGLEITPFYIEAINTDSEVYVAINKLLLWSSFHEVSLPRTLIFLRSLLKSKVHLVPEWEDPSSGILYLFPPRRYTYLSPLKEYKEKLICNDLDLFCILGGYVEPPDPNAKGRRDFMRWAPRAEKNSAAVLELLDEHSVKLTHEVKNARLPKGYLDGHDPFYSDRGDARWRASFILHYLI